MAHPITSHSSEYPSRQWKRFSKPPNPSEDPIWLEMTANYNGTMAARHLHFLSNRIGEIITDTNLQRLSDEAYQYMRKKAHRKIAFETQADISFVQAIMAGFRDDMKYTKENQMETIREGEEFKAEHYAPRPRIPASVEISQEDTNQLAQFRRLLTKNEVESSFRQRLEEIVQQYSQISRRKAITNDPEVAWNLFLLRDEVQAHVFQWQLRTKWQLKDLLEHTKGRPKISRRKSIKAQMERAFHIS